MAVRTIVVGLLLATTIVWAQTAPRPAVLILPGRDYSPLVKPDYVWLNELHQHGFDLDVQYLKRGDLPPWEVLSKHHALVIVNLPEYGEASAALLNRYLQAGGGLFLMPELNGYAGTLRVMKNWERYLAAWGAKIPLEHVDDRATVALHPRSTRKFVYTDRILPSPVSDGVTGLWFPGGEQDNWAFHAWGHPLDLTADWTPVVRGSDTSFTRPMQMVTQSAEKDLLPTMTRRAAPQTPPTLYAIRQVGPGRVALLVSDPIMHLYGGKSWIHDGVMLDKGLAGRPSHLGKLFENTVKWLAESALKSGHLGGYVQDPLALKHPNQRKAPKEYFGEFDSYQNPTPPGNVFRGVIGVRTAYSTGGGTVRDYAAAARAAGLDFLVFTEDLGRISETNYRKLEQECRDQTTPELVLIPGLAFANNIGNPMWAHGFEISWPKPSQLTGPNQDQLRLQCFDKEGKLTYNDEDAKNWLWQFHGVSKKNVGYYDFTQSPGVPVRNLRLFGILSVITYRDGRQIEDLTKEYLDYVSDSIPPLACAYEVITSPADLTRAVADNHALTHVAAGSRGDIVAALQYGHQYGRPNVYPSSGPQIKAWAGTQRFSTYAGESFVTARRRARPEMWVTAEAGLKEIVIYTETQPYRRLLLNGAKEFHETFEWAYDRGRELVAIITDMKGNRAVSASRSLWSDANYNGWCNDRQNGELWHGAGTVPGPRRPTFSVGPTWDGGPPPPAFGVVDLGPGVLLKDGTLEGYYRLKGGRWMEGNQYPTCYDDVCANAACDNEYVYAPGVVANSYHTLGPIESTKIFRAHLRRTQFLQRPAGVNLDWHSMYPERAGGSAALMEGTYTLKQDADLEVVDYLNIWPHSFPQNQDNIPLLAVNDGQGTPALGRAETFDGPGIGRGLGPKSGNVFMLQPGGYVAMLPTSVGLPLMVFNAGEEPVQARATKAFGAWWLTSPPPGPSKQGQQFSYRLLCLYDALDEPVINTLRLENLRRYLGFTGENGCHLQVQRGKLVSQRGIIEVEPVQGVVEYTIPNPGWRVGVPLGIRFRGFNPNWTVGEWQIEGYTQGFYTNGKNVYRQLGPDDRGLVHLSMYPDCTPNSHSVVGHPVQCDQPGLIIEFTKLADDGPAANDKPEFRVAVNNPTDQPLQATLKKGMDLPGFNFPDAPINVPAGGYVVVRAK